MLEKKLVVANWKSNKNVREAQQWVETFLERERQKIYEYVVCPPLSLLSFVSEHADKAFSLGVQNISPFDAGAYTGEVSGYSLQGLNIQYAILGHSERRKYVQETSKMVAQKAAEALSYDITPIICIDIDQVKEQALQLGREETRKSIIAYEPVHSISTFGGHEDPLAVTLKNIETIRKHFGDVPVLYGGSVDHENSFTYLQEKSIDGVLVGHASLDPVEFSRL